MWHEGLVLKMLHHGFPKYRVELVQSFLRDRTFRVTLDGTISTERKIKAGVPQGSCLSPLLFNIYMADIPQTRTTELLAYADDTAIAASSRTKWVVIRRLQKHLDSIADWMDRWRLRVNPSKTQAILFNQNKKRPPRDLLRWKDTRLKWTGTAKYLGILYDARLTWRAHVQAVRRKAQAQLSTLYPLIGWNSSLNQDTKIMIYKLYIRPILSYAAPAWATVSPEVIQALQGMKNRILRMIVQAPWFVRNSTLRREFPLEPLVEFFANLARSHFTKAETSNNPVITDIHVRAEPGARLRYPKDTTT